MIRLAPSKRIFLFGLFITIALIGCIWQISSIFQLYFSYPTIDTVTIDTELSRESELPTITICSELGNSSESTVKLIIEEYNATKIEECLIYNDAIFDKTDCPSSLKSQLVESVNNEYYCFSINDQRNGKLVI
jgi:hypothetical protein